VPKDIPIAANFQFFDFNSRRRRYLPGLAQFDSPMLGLPAFKAMAFDSLVQTVIGAHNAFLALIVGLHSSCSRKKS